MSMFSKIYGYAIVGGGASGLIAALELARLGKAKDVVVLERTDRVGKKLIATGNGQGNLYNVNDGIEHYANGRFAGVALSRFGARSAEAFYRSLGVLPSVKGDGRAYPSGYQASAVLDLMRARLAFYGVEIRTEAFVTNVRKKNGIFTLSYGKEVVAAQKVLLAAGGKAAKQFGTDGSAYALAQSFGHTVTKTMPSLVQLVTEREPLRGLKGVKADCVVSVLRGERAVKSARGEVLFTDYGVSGNAVFSVSGAAAEGTCALSLSFLPDVSSELLAAALQEKVRNAPYLPFGEILTGILPKQLGRVLVKRAGENISAVVATVKDFRLKVTGSLDFSAAQVTKGGIDVRDVRSGTMESTLEKGLFFSGEILDVDGDCGGYNLLWAYASACAAAEGMTK